MASRTCFLDVDPKAYEALELADPIFSIPWQLIVSKLIMGLTSTFGLPLMVMTIAHVWRCRSEHSEFNHINPQSFGIEKLWIACGIVLVVVAPLSARQSAPVRRLVSGSRPLLGRRTALSILLAATMFPLMGCYGPCQWWHETAQMYVDCAAACTGGSKPPKYCKGTKFIPDYLRNGTKYKDLRSKKEERLNAHKCQSIFDKASDKGDSTDYMDHMYENDAPFMAFEAMVRRKYKISLIEIYGSTAATLWLVFLLVTRLALVLRRQEMNGYRNHFLWQNMMSDMEIVPIYYNLFSYMHALKWEDWRRAREEYVVKALNNAKTLNNAMDPEKKDEAPNNAKALNNANDLNNAKALDNANNEALVFNIDVDNKDADCCQQAKRNCTVALWAFCWAVVHASIPIISRLMMQDSPVPASTEELGKLFSECSFKEVTFANFAVCLLSEFFVVLTVQYDHDQYDKRYHELLAFECMWRFPESHPLDTVKQKGDKKSLQLISKTLISGHKDVEEAQSIISGYEEDEESSGGKDEEFTQFLKKHHGRDYAAYVAGKKVYYRADFSSRDFRKLSEELDHLNAWYYMRQYLQMDNVDERIATEVSSVVILFTALPAIGVMVLDVAFRVRGHASKFYVGQYQAIFDVILVMFLLWNNLGLTLSLNDVYADHRSNLQKLREHIGLAYATKQHAAKKQDETEQSRGQGYPWAWKSQEKHEKDPLESEKREKDPLESKLDYLKLFEEGLQRFDRPPTMLGLRINKASVTYLFSALSTLAIPYALSAVSRLFSA